VALVEPEFHSPFPPLGLLKISSYHKSRGDTVELIQLRGKVKKGHFSLFAIPSRYPDRVYITSLYTWTWEPVWKAVKFYKQLFPKAEIWLGGIYASIMPDHAKQSGAHKVIPGVWREVENFPPDYGLVPEWDGFIVHASRGCNRRCPYCMVPKTEGKLKAKQSILPLILDPKSGGLRHSFKNLYLFDNNILQAKNWPEIFKELVFLHRSFGLRIDFNQGLDARLITDQTARLLSQIESWRKFPLRIAYDTLSQRKAVRQAIRKLKSSGIDPSQILAYALFNHREGPEEFLSRVQDLLELGVAVYPMRYQPLYALTKNSYISPSWSLEKLERVERFRRIVGGKVHAPGSLPPFNALREKFLKAKSFNQAFEVYAEAP